MMSNERVMQKLHDLCLGSVFIESYTIESACSEHQLLWINRALTLFLRVRIHHFVKIRNQELKQLADKQKKQLLCV